MEYSSYNSKVIWLIQNSLCHKILSVSNTTHFLQRKIKGMFISAKILVRRQRSLWPWKLKAWSTHRIERHEGRFLYCTDNRRPYLWKIVCWNFHNGNEIKTCRHFENRFAQRENAKTARRYECKMVRTGPSNVHVSIKDGGFQVMRKVCRKKAVYPLISPAAVLRWL